MKSSLVVSSPQPLLVVVLIALASFSPIVAAQDNIACLQDLKQSLIDPLGYLGSWTFGSSTPPSALCNYTGVQCLKNQISSIKLASANLSGSFPTGLWKCLALQELDLSNNSLHGGIPSNISLLLPFITSLDLSANNFSDSLPVGLATCFSLEVLHLQNNGFTGTIPWQIGFLPRLTDLNLSYNNFSGQIPSSFTQRSYVNLPAFNASSFAGNPGLCGAPLNETCTAYK